LDFALASPSGILQLMSIAARPARRRSALAALALLAAAGAWAAPEFTPASAPSLAALGAPSTSAAPVAASLLLETETIRGGESFLAAVLLEVAEGWHVYGRDEGEGLPTEVEWALPTGFSAGPTLYPELESFAYEGLSGLGMTGRVLLVARISPPAVLEPEAAIAIRARASWLACSYSCVPGGAELEARVTAAAAGDPAHPGPASPAALELRAAYDAAQRASSAARGAAPSASALGLGLALLLAFLGGILLNLMPCVLPVISLKIAGLVRNAAGAEAGIRGRAAAHGLAYGAGILVSFWALAGILLALRSGGAAAGWGFQFQDPRIVALVSAAFFLVSLNFFGVFEVGTRLASLAGGAEGALSRRRAGLAASFASGLFATAAATPCTAPFMGAALGWALAQPPASAFAVFTALGTGMALPYVLVTALPALSKRLPKPGRWMESLRIAMGFPLMAAALWMAYLLVGLSGAGAAFRFLAALLAAGLGAWIWGRWGGYDASRRARAAAAALALILVLGSLIAALAGLGDGRASKVGLQAPAGGADPDSIWESWSSARVEDLLAEGRPVFVDFSAEWCLTCALNEAAVLGTERALAAFRERDVALLKADWTARDDAIARELAAHGRAGVPLYLLYAGDGSPPLVLPELLSVSLLLRALDGIPLKM